MFYEQLIKNYLYSRREFVVAHDPNAFKKIAVLTGLTVLIGGTEISKANANTMPPQTDTFFYSIGAFGCHGGSSNTSIIPSIVCGI